MEKASRTIATAVVVALFSYGCLLPDVTDTATDDSVAADTESASVSAQSEPAATEQPAASEPARTMQDERADAGQAVAAMTSAGDASASETSRSPQDAGSAEVDSSPGDDTTAACSCTTKDECCDGCRPLNEGGACPSDGYGCTVEVCRAGACVHEDRTDACWADGLCHKAGEPHFTNKCLFCDPAQNHKGWSPRPFGFACSDNNHCNGDDFCGRDAQAGVCVHPGECDPSYGSLCDMCSGSN